MKSEFVDGLETIFERPIRAVGITLATKESIIDTATNSPFILLLEPFFNDPSDTKLVAHVAYTTTDADTANIFLERLYQRLKSLIEELNNGHDGELEAR